MSQGDLVELLRTLELQGRKDSAGIFTLDVRQLLPKLADFQLSRSEDYVLKLVQGAVRSGATWVDVDCYGHSVEVRFDGPGFQPEQVAQLFAYVFEDHPQAMALKHLAIGVTSALAHHARWVQLESGGVRRRWSMLELDASTPPARSRLKRGLTRFLLARNLGDTLGHWWENVGRKDIVQMLIGGPQAMLPEQTALWRACRYCSVPLRLNGKRVTAPTWGPPASTWRSQLGHVLGTREDPYYPEHLLAERHLFIAQPAGFGFPARSRASLFDRFATGHCHETAARGAPAPAMVGIQYALGWPSQVHFYHSGALVATHTPASRIPGLVAVVHADDLALDLSQFSLVGSDLLRDRLAWVVEEALHLAHHVREKASVLPLPSRLNWTLDRLPPLSAK